MTMGIGDVFLKLFVVIVTFNATFGQSFEEFPFAEFCKPPGRA